MRVARSEALAGGSGRSCVRPGRVRGLLLLGRGLLAVCLAVGVRSGPVRAAERRDPLDTAALLATSYRVAPDLVYLSTPGWEGKVDLYLPRRPEHRPADGGAVPWRRLGDGQQGRDRA